jgi:NAD(P)-dependent dehydrogenase (short-subunit alcohol dehydrogenase family)
VSRAEYDFRFPHKTSGLVKYNNISTVIWCNGLNANDHLATLDSNTYDTVMDVNVNGIVKSMSFLIKENRLAPRARLCIISSILQDYGRANKLSYSISKSALRGLVTTTAIELKRFGEGVHVNAILPGPIENEMTRQTVTDDEYERLRPYFVDPQDIANMCNLLCFDNRSITGQFFTIDNGLTGHIRY